MQVSGYRTLFRKEFSEGIRYFRPERLADAMSCLIDLLKLAGQIALRTGYDCYAERGPIPDLCRVQLGDRKIEGVPQTILQ